MTIHLNKEQKEAISYYEGPSLIIAGAGSGKTRVLTEKICNLIQEKLYLHLFFKLRPAGAAYYNYWIITTDQ